MKYSAKDIEDIIYQYLPKSEGYQKDVTEAMNYAFMAGGKRVRPLIMKLCHDMFCAEKDKALGLFMAAIEMIHTYSLIHDDLPALDNDELRRGKPTVHVKFGEDIAILAGDGLLNFAYETAAGAFSERPGDTAVEQAYLYLTKKPGINGMIGGQTLDVVMSGKTLDEEQLTYIYENKTAALIECSMMIGATLGGADEKTVKQLEEAGRAVGLAFQVQDDILDLTGDETKLGKPLLSDEKNNKTTYVSIYGMEQAAAYVRDMSDKAEAILRGLTVVNEEARAELIELVNRLIDRDK
ncbi:MAG: polyprenyl synthetase family protein [Clostridium sp.]|nr:polyprenyl synthetase family protein [Clostridium sp.]MCM1399424.1 polyprenyl synthetase family protein [Clostridium sp.]MCM1459978.1 polyprenyl synthetase family protein [Bacteroides sp.]